MANCNDYISADDLKTGEQAILHIEHVAKSRDANGDPALEVTDTIRGESVTNKTLDGLEHLYETAISQVGYTTLKSFQLGAPLPNNELTLPNQVLQDETNGEYYRWDGAFPKSVPSGSTPTSTGGVGLGAWLSVGDASLRSDLVKEDGYKLIGGIGFRYVNIAAEIGDDFENNTIIIAKYGFSSGDLAGGYFIYYSNRTLSADKGIVINVGSTGQLVRYGFKKNIYPYPVSIQWYGAIPHSDDYDNAIAINAALASPYTTEVSVDDYYLVKTSVVMQSKKALVGRSPSWAYADSGFNMVGTIALSDNHTLGYLDPIVDCRYKRQTTLISIDIDGKGHDVTCIEYGRRVRDTSDSQSYNNHVRRDCVFRAARMGLRSDNAGLHKSFGEQITGCIEAGIYSENNFSDSTYVSPYINEIGYHSGENPSDLRAIFGVGIHLGPHSGVAFIGGKIEYTRIHIQAIGSSYVRFSNMWLDIAKRAAVVFMGSPDGSGRNNFIDNCIITGGGYTDPVNGAAVTVDGEFGTMNLTITGGNITAADENINPDATTAPTFGAKLAGVKVGNNPNGIVSINGTDMRKCSLSYTVYAYGNSRVIDRSISTLPNSVSGGSTVNGYLYDSGNESRGFLLREATDDASAASSGVPVGGFYLKNTNQVCIRKS